MSLDQLIGEAAPEWREDFRYFVETGEASPRLVALMDGDNKCQQLVERAFEVQASDIKAAVVRIGGPGSGVPEAAPAEVGEDSEPAETVVVPHPAVAGGWQRWQPYAAAAVLVLAVAMGFFVTGLSSIVDDQDLRMAELRREGAERMALVRSSRQERDQHFAMATRWEQAAQEIEGERLVLKESLDRQQTELASLRTKYASLKRQRAPQQVVYVARQEDQPEAQGAPHSAPVWASWETAAPALTWNTDSTALASMRH